MAADAINRLEAQIRATNNRMESVGDSRLAPPTFAGNINEDFSNFLGRLNLYFDSKEMTEAQKLAKFPLYLTDSAFTQYQKCRPADRDTWDHLQAWFRAEFCSQENRMIWKNELSKRKLLPGESLQSYSAAIETLCRKLNMNEEDTVASFINNLPPNVATVVAPQAPATLARALQIACLYTNAGGTIDTVSEKKEKLSESVADFMIKQIQEKDKQIEEKNISLREMTEILKSVEGLLKKDDTKPKQIKSILPMHNSDMHEDSYQTSCVNQIQPVQPIYYYSNHPPPIHIVPPQYVSSIHQTEMNMYPHQTRVSNQCISHPSSIQVPPQQHSQHGSQVQCFECARFGHVQANCKNRPNYGILMANKAK